MSRCGRVQRFTARHACQPGRQACRGGHTWRETELCLAQCSGPRRRAQRKAGPARQRCGRGQRKAWRAPIADWPAGGARPGSAARAGGAPCATSAGRASGHSARQAPSTSAAGVSTACRRSEAGNTVAQSLSSSRARRRRRAARPPGGPSAAAGARARRPPHTPAPGGPRGC